jgi:amidohydrolase
LRATTCRRQTGTFRCFDSDLCQKLFISHRRIVDGIATSLGYIARVTTEFLTPAVVNDPTMTRIARHVAAQVMDADHVIQPDPLTGSDDVAYFWQKLPGCYALVGSTKTEWSPPPAHHNPKFDIDDSVMEIGADLLARAARRIRQSV